MPIVSLNELMFKIKTAKIELERLYNLKGHTDFEVLRQGDKVDRLLNEYQRMMNRIGA